MGMSFWTAAPKGSMTYDSTQGNFLRVSESPSLRVSIPPSPPEPDSEAPGPNAGVPGPDTGAPGPDSEAPRPDS